MSTPTITKGHMRTQKNKQRIKLSQDTKLSSLTMYYWTELLGPWHMSDTLLIPFPVPEKLHPVLPAIEHMGGSGYPVRSF